MTRLAAYRGGTFNGEVGNEDVFTYGIGVASSSDGLAWTKGAHVLTAAGSGDETAFLTDPCLVDAAGTLHLYYAAVNGDDSGFGDPTMGRFTFSILLATSTDGGATWTKQGQVLDVGAASAWDEGNVRYPFVAYDVDESDASRRWKMWYCGTETVHIDTYSIGYAYSADGLSWTKHGQVLAPGSSGTYDFHGLRSPVVALASGTYHLFYGAVTNADALSGQTKLAKATFTDPEGTYTKSGSNPLLTLPARSTDNEPLAHYLTADVAAGDTHLFIGDTSDFAVGDVIAMRKIGPTIRFAQITAIPSGTRLDFTPPAPSSLSHTSGSNVVHFWLGRIEPRSIANIEGTWVIYGTAGGPFVWQPDTGAEYQDYPSLGRAVTLTASSLTGSWSIGDLLLPLGDRTTVWDEQAQDGSSGWDADAADQLSVPATLAGLPIELDSSFFHTPFTDIQHVTANTTNVVVIADAYGDVTFEHASIDVAVFDLTGALLNVWSIATPPDPFGATDTLSGLTGSCLDDTHVYFGVVDGATADEDVVSVELATGTLTKLFTIDALDATIEDTDPSFLGLGAPAGIVEKDGDLIIAGSNGIVRTQQDGTPVWWANIPDLAQSYRGLAHSGNGSVWVSQTTNVADEYAYDGTYRQTITIIEDAPQLWLIKTPGGWSVDWIRF